jgi:hypothetical protein
VAINSDRTIAEKLTAGNKTAPGVHPAKAPMKPLPAAVVMRGQARKR